MINELTEIYALLTDHNEEFLVIKNLLAPIAQRIRVIL